MNNPVPKLSLSQGQVLWVLSGGQPPSDWTRHQLRYLRQLDVPFKESKWKPGRGNRFRYGYDELVEMGVALYALRQRVRPRDVAGSLVKYRKDLKQQYREAYEEQPPAAIEADWVKSRGQSIPMLANERFLRIHDRFSKQPGTIEMLGMDEVIKGLTPFDVVERYPGEVVRPLVPLTRVVLQLVAWAQEAPEIKPGRK